MDGADAAALGRDIRLDSRPPPNDIQPTSTDIAGIVSIHVILSPCRRLPDGLLRNRRETGSARPGAPANRPREDNSRAHRNPANRPLPAKTAPAMNRQPSEPARQARLRHGRSMPERRGTSRPPDLTSTQPAAPNASRDDRPRRHGLPLNPASGLRHLDDGQLDRLLRAAIDEMRRRGRSAGDVPNPGPVANNRGCGRPSSVSGPKSRPAPVPPGQEKIIRAAFEADVKPAAIARQFRIARAGRTHPGVARVIPARSRKRLRCSHRPQGSIKDDCKRCVCIWMPPVMGGLY